MLKRITGITYIEDKVDKLKQRTNAKLQKAKDNAVRGGLVLLALGFIVWLSIFIYIVFYYTYIPPVMHTRPIHLQFKTCEDGGEKKCQTFPSAHIQLTRKKQLLMVGQKYSISIELELPESEPNQQQGMFLVCAELNSADGVLLSHGCRSTMLRYTSWLLRALRTLLFAPAYLLGTAEEKQTLRVDIITDYVDDITTPVTDAFVEIRSRKVDIYSAKLLISAHFSGLRHLMYHWPTISALAGIGLVLGTLLMLLGLSWQQIEQGEGLAARAGRHIRDRLIAFADEEEECEDFPKEEITFMDGNDDFLSEGLNPETSADEDFKDLKESSSKEW